MSLCMLKNKNGCKHLNKQLRHSHTYGDLRNGHHYMFNYSCYVCLDCDTFFKGTIDYNLIEIDPDTDVLLVKDQEHFKTMGNMIAQSIVLTGSIKGPLLIIIRGIPGSGKSTLASKLSESFKIKFFEADQYFVNENGEYNWDGSKLKLAHETCKNNVKNELANNRSVIVSNTFVKDNHLEEYLKLTENCLVITMKENYGSIHDCPQETIKRMEKELENTKIKSDFEFYLNKQEYEMV